jgi:hypothetical protein
LEVSLGGKTLMVSNRGSHDGQARHFGHPETAREWTKESGIEIVNPDWAPPEGTKLWPPR